MVNKTLQPHINNNNMCLTHFSYNNAKNRFVFFFITRFFGYKNRNICDTKLFNVHLFLYFARP